VSPRGFYASWSLTREYPPRVIYITSLSSASLKKKTKRKFLKKKLVHGAITCDVLHTKTSELVMHDFLIKKLQGAITCAVVPKKNTTLDIHDLLKIFGRSITKN
jgi:hypothetical protein